MNIKKLLKATKTYTLTENTLALTISGTASLTLGMVKLCDLILGIALVPPNLFSVTIVMMIGIVLLALGSRYCKVDKLN